MGRQNYSRLRKYNGGTRSRKKEGLVASISVVTPSYNYSRFLPAAISSIRANSLRAEHVIADGGSTDATIALLSSMEDQVIWVSEPDKGQSDALNKALAMASGEVVGWLNADDFYLPGALDAVAAEFEADPELDVLYGDTVLVDENGRVIRIFKCYPIPSLVLRWRGCVMMSTSTFFRRDVLGEAPFDTEFRELMDWDLFLSLKANRKVKFKYLARPLGAFRIHDAQVTNVKSGGFSPEHARIRDKHGISRRWAPVTRPIGFLIHRLMKVLTGSLFQEIGSKRLKGKNLLNGAGGVRREGHEILLGDGE